MELNEFKAFVKTIPGIREEVTKGRYTWQQIYEFYVLYGENDKMWDAYRYASRNQSLDLEGIMNVVKNVDLDALSKSFDGIQKVLDLVGGLMIKDEKPASKQWYDN